MNLEPILNTVVTWFADIFAFILQVFSLFQGLLPLLLFLFVLTIFLRKLIGPIFDTSVSIINHSNDETKNRERKDK